MRVRLEASRLSFEDQFNDHCAKGVDTILEQDHVVLELVDPLAAVGELLLEFLDVG
ncbi:hypothetical protein AB0K00_18085 [Dactylosporangium sp. NPDC049525]|uniref:hypothetical protein n=1 Tax=Dactylosporangium sp. NPDC049525 TaxID=3154730 RepID=UPI003423040A